jgi:hypothetical protein
MNLVAITLNDWLTIIAIFSSPLLAVQVQKWLERFWERRDRKRSIFQTLMATRAARLSSDHTNALNMIDIEFYGHTLFGHRFQSAADKEVTIKWHEYLDQLSQPVKNNDTVWETQTYDRLVELLNAMSHSLGYNFDKVYLKRAIYMPKAHHDQEAANIAIRDNLVQVLEGNRSIRVIIMR